MPLVPAISHGTRLALQAWQQAQPTIALSLLLQLSCLLQVNATCLVRQLLLPEDFDTACVEPDAYGSECLCSSELYDEGPVLWTNCNGAAAPGICVQTTIISIALHLAVEEAPGGRLNINWQLIMGVPNRLGELLVFPT